MTYIPFLAAEGIVESLTDSAQRTGETFGFNTWLFFSQIISFVIVALILQHFAYKPILNLLKSAAKKSRMASPTRKKSSNSSPSLKSAIRSSSPRPTPMPSA